MCYIKICLAIFDPILTAQKFIIVSYNWISWPTVAKRSKTSILDHGWGQGFESQSFSFFYLDMPLSSLLSPLSSLYEDDNAGCTMTMHARKKNWRRSTGRRFRIKVLPFKLIYIYIYLCLYHSNCQNKI